MEHISVNGEQYVKASSIARELGYTADYVGQLARSGKVEAQLVGRSWFVSERALRDHKRDRYRSTAAKSREALRESLASYTPSASRSLTQEAHFYKKATSIPSYQYEPDSHDLIPILPEREHVELPDEPQQSTVQAVEEPVIPVEETDTAEAEEVTEETQEASEDVLEPVTEDIRVPIRAIHHPPLKHAKVERKPVRSNLASQYETVIAETKTKPERVVVAGRGAGGAVLVGILSAMLALAAFCAFVGVEGQVVAENRNIKSSYQFNFAAAYEAFMQK